MSKPQQPLIAPPANAIPYGKQSITQADLDAVARVLQHDFLTKGPAVDRFEAAFAEYIGSSYAVAVANGTAALHLCAMALNVQPGTKVITTPVTFAASANCVRYCGGEVVFADIDASTGLIDVNSVANLLESAPAGTYSGIIPVDLAGLPVQLADLRELADKHNLWIIEDACHAPGGSGSTWRCGDGRLAELAIFSFHPVKHIACGEGGMITTNDKALYERLRVLRTHGITKDPEALHENHGGWYYEMQELGYNYRLSDIHCALGLSQLERAAQGLEKRRAIAQRYEAAFAELPLQVVGSPAEDVGHAYHLFVIRTANRKALYEHLRAHNIFAQVHYIPLHLLPYYQSLGWKKGDFPQAELYYSECLSLPMYPTLTETEQDYVIQTIYRFYEQ